MDVASKDAAHATVIFFFSDIFRLFLSSETICDNPEILYAAATWGHMAYALVWS